MRIGIDNSNVDTDIVEHHHASCRNWGLTCIGNADKPDIYVKTTTWDLVKSKRAVLYFWGFSGKGVDKIGGVSIPVADW